MDQIVTNYKLKITILTKVMFTTLEEREKSSEACKKEADKKHQRFVKF